MSNINPTYRNRVRFWIDNKTVGRKIIEEPLGWDEDQKEYARHKRHGIFPTLSNSLYFFGESLRLLDYIWKIEGVKANVMIIKEEKHPHTSQWVRSYWGFLDMLTREVEDDVVSFKFNSGGVEKLRSSRERQKVEIESLTTIDGETLPELDVKTTLLEGRRIFLKTVFDIESTNNSARMFFETESGNSAELSVGFPLHVFSKSHEHAHSIIPDTISENNIGTVGNMFFVNSGADRFLRVIINITFKMHIEQEDVDHSSAGISLSKFKDGSSYNLKSRHDFVWWADKWAIFNSHNQTYTITYDEIVEVLNGESLSLEMHTHFDLLNNGYAKLDMRCVNITGNLTIEEDSYKEPTQTKTVLAYELVDRILKMTTNTKVKLYSEALGRTDLGYPQDGIASLKGYSHGMWIRGFDKLPEDDDNRYKAFTTNFRDVLDDLEVTHNLGLGIEQIGYTERYIIEPRDYFYQDKVAYRLPYKVQKVKRKVSEDYLFGSVNIGFTDGFENEEAQGLDDYHANSTWNTTLGSVSNIYQKISKFLASSYAVEFIRRKPKSDFETFDHKNDKKIFVFDLKRYTSALFKEKKWQDDLEQEPFGVFSPETATKLLFSPLNLLLRHAKFFSGGFIKFPFDYLRFGSAEGNKNLDTKPINGVERYENIDIQNMELDRPIIDPEEIEFEHEITFEINQALQGYTEINGRKVPNLYLMWEFTNEKGELEKGFIDNVKLNNGKWKLLKANR